MQDTSTIATDINTRLRILERTQENLREKLLIVNQNMIEEYKNLIIEIKNMNQNLHNMKKELVQTQETIKVIVREMDSFAKKNQLKFLEKYINMWNPLDFVTINELDNLIKKGENAKRKKGVTSK